jgi:hypothetical protein
MLGDDLVFEGQKVGYIVPQAAPIPNAVAGWLFLMPAPAWGLDTRSINLCEPIGIQLPVGPPLVKPKP